MWIGRDDNIGITLAGVSGQEKRSSQNAPISRHISPNHTYPCLREADEARLTTSPVTPSIPEIGTKLISHTRGPPRLWSLVKPSSLILGCLELVGPPITTHGLKCLRSEAPHPLFPNPSDYRNSGSGDIAVFILGLSISSTLAGHGEVSIINHRSPILLL